EQLSRLKDSLTVAEVVELLEDNISENEDAEVQNIFIAPPAANELTNEDSGNEDTRGFLNNFLVISWSNLVELKDSLTVAEVVQLLEENISENEDAEVQDIFIAPPAANELTNEDSGNKDTRGFLNNSLVVSW
ncbi:hypothetical protein ILUMI_10554, partial [Ignelater luminosus]